METCQLTDFLNAMDPWLDRDYIAKVFTDGRGRLVLAFADGGQKAYQIDDCSAAQLKGVIAKFIAKGIAVEKLEGTC